ncbi:MAG: rod shape-determining protein MreC [Armatimonadota bacterium]
MRRQVLFVAAIVLATLGMLTLQVRLPERRDVGPVGSLVLAVMGPVHTGLARVADGLARLWRPFSDISRLRAENARLREDVERLSAEVSRLRERAQATQRLERLLAFRSQVPGRAIGARVIGRDATQWFAVIVLDRGSQDGVRRNDTVVAAEGLVGRVLTVSATTSQVLLISDTRSAVGVILQQSREAGVVEGLGQASLRLKYVTRAREVPVGEVIVTSGQAGVFPRGLPVGTVASVTREQSAFHLEAVVRPAVPLDQLEDVLILIESRPDR